MPSTECPVLLPAFCTSLETAHKNGECKSNTYSQEGIKQHVDEGDTLVILSSSQVITEKLNSCNNFQHGDINNCDASIEEGNVSDGSKLFLNKDFRELNSTDADVTVKTLKGNDIYNKNNGLKEGIPVTYTCKRSQSNGFKNRIAGLDFTESNRKGTNKLDAALPCGSISYEMERNSGCDNGNPTECVCKDTGDRKSSKEIDRNICNTKEGSNCVSYVSDTFKGRHKCLNIQQNVALENLISKKSTVLHKNGINTSHMSAINNFIDFDNQSRNDTRLDGDTSSKEYVDEYHILECKDYEINLQSYVSENNSPNNSGNNSTTANADDDGKTDFQEEEDEEEKESDCSELEKKYVHDVYDQTAHHFTDAKYKAWPRVKRFLQELSPGSAVLDVGCGHGKYLGINEGIYKVGSDHSAKLVNIAGDNGHQVLVCDNLLLPFRSECCDAVISIGVIHHFTTVERRIQAIAELARVLCPGGRLMMYVWALEQKHRKFRSQDVLVPWHLKGKEMNGKESTSAASSISGDDLNDTQSEKKPIVLQQKKRSSSSNKGCINNSANMSQEKLIRECILVGKEKQDGNRNSNGICDRDIESKITNENQCSGKLLKQGTVYSDDSDSNRKSPFHVKKVGVTACLTTAVASSNVTEVFDPEVCSGKMPYVQQSEKENQISVHPKMCSKPPPMEKPCSESQFSNSSPSIISYESACNTKLSASAKLCSTSHNLSLGSRIKNKFFSIFMPSKLLHDDDSSSNNKPITTEGSHNLQGDVFSNLCSLTCHPQPIDLCEGFAVREFPLSSQASEDKEDEDILALLESPACVKNNSILVISNEDDISENSVFANSAVSIDANTSKFDASQYFSNRDCDSKALNCNDSTEKFDGSNNCNILSDNHSVFNCSNEYMEQANSIINSSQSDSTKGKSNKGGNKSKLYKLSCSPSLHRKVITKTSNVDESQEEEVKFNVGNSDSDSDSDSGWITTTSNAIRNIESDLEKKASSDKSLGDAVKTSEEMQINSVLSNFNKTVLMPKNLRKNLSASSSFSSFSSDNFSDSEVEDTLVCNSCVNKRLDVRRVEQESQVQRSHCSSRTKSSTSQSSNTKQSFTEFPGYKTDSSNGGGHYDIDSDIFKRYYHVFRENELDDLICKSIPCLKIVHSSYDHANWCIVAEKI